MPWGQGRPQPPLVAEPTSIATDGPLELAPPSRTSNGSLSSKTNELQGLQRTGSPAQTREAAYQQQSTAPRAKSLALSPARKGVRKLSKPPTIPDVQTRELYGLVVISRSTTVPASSAEEAIVGRILVVDYSRSGNTHMVAEAIASGCGADLERIKDVRPRQGLWGWLRSGHEAIRGTPAAIGPTALDPSDYDLVVIGSPVWAGHMSSPMRSYLRHRDGKLAQVALFVTEGGSGGPKALSEMTALTGSKPVATLELRAKDIDGDLRSQIRAFVARVKQAAETPATNSRVVKSSVDRASRRAAPS